MKSFDECVKYVWVTLLGMGTFQNYCELLSEFETLDKAWEASKNNGLIYAFSDKSRLNETFYDDNLKTQAEEICRKCREKCIKIICFDDEEYPSKLKDYDKKPFLLYAEGNVTKINEKTKCLGIVGSRRCTAYGNSAILSLVRGLHTNKEKLAIISGMARGIDTAGHRAALENNIFTIAVLGCGTNVIYPMENYAIYKQIKEKGVILSEYPPDAVPFKSNFPARNRIVAGMCDAVLVAEAGLSSGALITADFAADAGKDVMAIPSNIDSSAGAGSNALIKQGAICVTSPDDISETLGLEQFTRSGSECLTEALSENEKLVLAAIYNAPAWDDEISEVTDLSIQVVKKCVTSLEINGFVKRTGDGKVRKLVN